MEPLFLQLHYHVQLPRPSQERYVSRVMTSSNRKAASQTGDKVNEYAGQAQEQVGKHSEGMYGQAKEQAGNLSEQAQKYASQAREHAGNLGEQAQQYANQAKEQLSNWGSK